MMIEYNIYECLGNFTFSLIQKSIYQIHNFLVIQKKMKSNPRQIKLMCRIIIIGLHNIYNV